MRSSGGRRALSTGVVLVVVTSTLALATLVSRHFFEGPTRELPPRHPTRPAVIAAAGASSLFRVAALEGPVAVKHNDNWYVAQAGDRLTLQDVIRTPKGGAALLRRGSTEIEVREDVELRLDALASQTASFNLMGAGKVVANVDDGKDQLAIGAHGTRAVNQGPARWVVSVAPSGQVSVASSRGLVLFSGSGKEVNVPAGFESTAPPGGPPGDSAPIPEDLLLSVIWPEISPPDGRVPVAGRVRPSTKVKVNGADAEVTPDGSFSTALPLTVGSHKVDVEAQDIVGRKKTVSKVLRRPPPTPSLESDGEELWKK